MKINIKVMNDEDNPFPVDADGIPNGEACIQIDGDTYDLTWIETSESETSVTYLFEATCS